MTKGIGIEKLCQATDTDFGNKEQVQNGWILHNNNQEEQLVVSFETPVYIDNICIYESLNPGSISKLEMLEIQRSKATSIYCRKAIDFYSY